MSGRTDPSEVYFKDGIWGWCVNHWNQLVSSAAGHLQVDVVTSGLPAGGATAANQATMITALELIDDLRAALDSVATDEILVNFHEQDVDVEVTQTAPADLTVGNYGWDGSAWHKLALVWGYSEKWAWVMDGTQSGDGNFVASTNVVPAGEIWILQCIYIRNQTGARGYQDLRVYGGGGYCVMGYSATPGVNEPLIWNGQIVLEEDDYARVLQTSCLNGDVIGACAWGYKMKVAE